MLPGARPAPPQANRQAGHMVPSETDQQAQSVVNEVGSVPSYRRGGGSLALRIYFIRQWEPGV